MEREQIWVRVVVQTYMNCGKYKVVTESELTPHKGQITFFSHRSETKNKLNQCIFFPMFVCYFRKADVISEKIICPFLGIYVMIYDRAKFECGKWRATFTATTLFLCGVAIFHLIIGGVKQNPCF